MSKFNVTQIPLHDPDEFETHPEGAIDKYWQDLPSIGRSLVKADLRGAWVEKVTAALAEQIGLPVAGCELVERADGLKMITSPSYLFDRAEETPGEKLLKTALGKNYLYRTHLRSLGRSVSTADYRQCDRANLLNKLRNTQRSNDPVERLLVTFATPQIDLISPLQPSC